MLGNKPMEARKSELSRGFMPCYDSSVDAPE
jgi:hypothetical protein